MAALFDFGLGNVDLWRSEEMQLVQLMIPSESAHDTVAALGDIGMLQFKDLNTEKSAFQRTYANQVKRCDEMARKLRFFSEQVAKAGLKPGTRTAFDKVVTTDELETKLDEMEREVLEVNANNERLQRTHAELAELQLLLEKAGGFFDTAREEAAQGCVGLGGGEANGLPGSNLDMNTPLLGRDREAGAGPDSGPKMSRLGFVAGLIAQERLPAFQRLLFRATRGNMFLRAAGVGAVQDPASGELVEKSVFVVFFAGERARNKITRICDAFAANRYPFPEEQARQRAMGSEVSGRLKELGTTLDAGDMHRLGVLRGVAANLDQWITHVRREKAVYHTLNKMSMDTSRRVLVAEAWVPSAARPKVAEALRRAAEGSENQHVSAVLQPLTGRSDPAPTYFQTNKVTECFQTIVDAYGIARYREVNPAVFTIVTFPFLFAVMFGDFGHGVLMLLFALLLVVKEKALGKAALDDMSSMAFAGRYCILFMALASIYTGALYNEFFSIPMNLAGDTHFQCMKGGELAGVPDLRDCSHAGGKVGFPAGSEPYPFGVDPSWRGTKTELPYLNSLKMKMSIVLGVLHMNLGILMSLLNNNYFRDRLSTWTEFVPQMIFLNGLFGYLVFLILYKWVSGSMADLYHVMIYMFLSPGTMDDQGRLFEGQGQFQLGLVLAALAAVPVMLFVKPLVLNARHKAAMQAAHTYRSLGGAADEEAHRPAAPAHSHGDHGHGEFDFSEVFVHQMIHTIEFVLGAVSNTASYLRLWALSLAHSQLSAVFYDRVLMAAVQSGNLTAMFIGWFVWAVATLGVLMVMESLSAFLHALRLHWVEFQNKFYKGDGYKFVPFSLAPADLADDL
ncbi:vacuolar proton ATPase subunit A [Haematococcus lacustris]